MADFGLFPEGLLVPTRDDIEADMSSKIRDLFGPNFPLGSRSLTGFFVGDLSERLDLLWSVLQQIVSAIDPDSATGRMLRSVGLLSGTIAPPPSPSFVTLTLCGDDSAPVPVGTLIRTVDTAKLFSVVDEDVTLSALPARATTTGYDVGDRVTSSSRCYECIQDGTTSGGAGPSSTSLDITDGTVHWTYIGEGEAAADAHSECTVVGPTVAIARSVSVFENEVLGVSSCTNLEDATLGTLEMSDEDFRELRESEVAAPGTGTGPAIEADVRRLDGVKAVFVFENDTDEEDDAGVPAHSFETLVHGGDDQEIRDAILRNKPLGIPTHGTVVGTAVDDTGKEHTIRFSRPEEIDVYVDVTLLEDPDEYAGDDEVKAAVATATTLIGANVVASKISRLVTGVSGVTDVPRSGSLGGVLVGTSPSPASDATIVITPRQLAVFSTSRVTVTSSVDPDL